GRPALQQVPYYWQDNLPWCVPTALAMLMNYYDLDGLTSNFQLAGVDGQADDEGNSYLGILGSLGMPDTDYDYDSWDADLIPSAPFNDWVKYWLNVQGRPLAMSSTVKTHAFVAVGASNTSIWLHDPSGAVSGSASI